MVFPIGPPIARPVPRAREPDADLKPVKKVSRVQPVRSSTRKREQLVRELEQREHELAQHEALRAEGGEKGPESRVASAYAGSQPPEPGILIDDSG